VARDDDDDDRDDDEDDDDEVEVESKKPAPKPAVKPVAKPAAKPASKPIAKAKPEPVDENIALLREIRDSLQDMQSRMLIMPLVAIVLLAAIAIFSALKL
jgi:hypothetical protein